MFNDVSRCSDMQGSKMKMKKQLLDQKPVMHSCMLEEFHAKPMEINCNNNDRKCQRDQEAVIPGDKEKPNSEKRERERRLWSPN